MKKVESDICLVLEGTYPYIPGGVSGWVHDLVLNQKQLKFSIISILPAGFPLKHAYDVPDNVVEIQNIFLQVLPQGRKRMPKKMAENLFAEIEMLLSRFFTDPRQEEMRRLYDIMRDEEYDLGNKLLMASPYSWNMLLRMYRATMGETTFLEYYWTWRAVYGGMFSLLKSPIPYAHCYHAISTGYAGLMLCRAHFETKKPCLLTEHGIYTNERRIELVVADWLPDLRAQNYNIKRPAGEKGLTDLYIDSFFGYSKITYDVCVEVLTLYKGNFDFQIADGADPKKLRVIANGIDCEKFAEVTKASGRPFTIAFIGRVVPIKDVKTFIRACAMLHNQIDGVVTEIVGPYQEDLEYYEECKALVEQLDMVEKIPFMGKQDLHKYLAKIDCLCLTSLSEAMPLTILEAGAVGSTSIATNVGACAELIEGGPDEDPPLGPGGIVTELANPPSTAAAMIKLATDKEFYAKCSAAMLKRVNTVYTLEMQHSAYRELYQGVVDDGKKIELE